MGLLAALGRHRREYLYFTMEVGMGRSCHLCEGPSQQELLSVPCIGGPLKTLLSTSVSNCSPDKSKPKPTSLSLPGFPCPGCRERGKESLELGSSLRLIT